MVQGDSKSPANPASTVLRKEARLMQLLHTARVPQHVSSSLVRSTCTQWDEQVQLGATCARRHVHQKQVQFAPLHLLQKGVNGAHDHWTSPDSRCVLL